MRHISAAALTFAATLLLFAPGQAAAKPALVELRVEGPESTLDPGTWYVTGTERVRRAKPGDDCDARKGTRRFAGRNALGLLGSADDWNRKLRPVRFRDTDFGPQVCQIGRLRSFGHYPNASGGFLYWTDFVSGFSSPDVATLKNGQSVLWYHATFPSDPPQGGEPEINTGQALELRGVPARDADGEFLARVVIHDFDGTPSPVDDAVIQGASSATSLGNGRYRVTVGKGTSVLTAERGADVRSNHVEACSKPKLGRCPRAHGKRIVGSSRGDELRGTRGFDQIESGAGADVVNLRKGGRDRVSCGPGRDVVRVDRGDRDDRIAGNCERLRRS